MKHLDLILEVRRINWKRFPNLYFKVFAIFFSYNNNPTVKQKKQEARSTKENPTGLHHVAWPTATSWSLAGWIHNGLQLPLPDHPYDKVFKGKEQWKRQQCCPTAWASSPRWWRRPLHHGSGQINRISKTWPSASHIRQSVYHSVTLSICPSARPSVCQSVSHGSINKSPSK